MLIHFKAIELIKKCSNKSTLTDRDIVTSHCDPQIGSCVREEARKAMAENEESKEPKKKRDPERLNQLLVINYSSIYHLLYCYDGS